MKRGVRLNSILALALLAPLVMAAEPPPERETSLVVYGEDPCPAGEDGEIVVCARKPESERYRIPKELREKDADLLESSWASRMASIEDATRDTWGAGCSVVGSAGLNGCFADMLRRWRAERAANATTP